MSRGVDKEEEIVAGNLRRSERLVVRTSRQEISEAEKEKERVAIEEGRRLGWSGVTPPYLSEDTTIDYNHLRETYNSTTVTTESDSDRDSNNHSETNNTVIENNSMASGGPPVDIPIPTGRTDLEKFFQFYANDQQRRDDNERDRREDERLRREQEIRDQRERDTRMWSAIQGTIARPDGSRPPLGLPKLKEGGDVESFITAFETSLTINDTPRDTWKSILVSCLPVEAIARINSRLDVTATDYDELTAALRGSNAVTFCSIAEDISTGEKGNIYKKDVRAAANRMTSLIEMAAKEALTIKQMAKTLSVVRLRDHLVPELKLYIDMGRRYEYWDFIAACEEWIRSQPGEVTCFKQQRSPSQAQGRGMGSSNVQTTQPQYAGPVLLWWRQ